MVNRRDNGYLSSVNYNHQNIEFANESYRYLTVVSIITHFLMQLNASQF